MKWIALLEAASWDIDEIENSARIAALEASAAGTNWTFAPMIDISRDARWGRVMEGAGEDPYLGSLIAAARVRGFQGDDLSKHYTIAATAKHFAAYGFSELSPWCSISIKPLIVHPLGVVTLSISCSG